MKKSALIILLFFLCYQAESQNHRPPESASSGIYYNSICYAGAQTFYIVGDSGYLLKSVNGGESFFRLNPQGSGTLYSVSFINPDTGYISGSNHLLLYTNDGGEHWMSRPANIISTVWSLHATTQNTVWAVGVLDECLGGPGAWFSCGEIIKSVNAGSSWTRESWGMVNTLFSVWFPSPDTGYVVGDYSICKAYNGGVWNANWIDTSTIFNSVHSPHAGTAYAVSLDGVVVKTSNSGTSWDIIQTGLPPHTLGAVWFTSDSTGYIGGTSGSMMKTTDGGQTWTLLNTGTNQFILSIAFSSPGTGIAVGSNKTILKTINAGITWNDVITGTRNEKAVMGRLHISPTPATDVITVIFPESVSPGGITVYSVGGSILIKQVVNGTRTRIDISRLPKGVYFLQFQNCEKALSGKILKD